MEENLNFNFNNIESEELLKAYEKIQSFVKFLDSEKEKYEVEETDE